ncbi:GNAT family N-acetyltransferase [Streptomyces sp. NBC_00461]|uniref:GNAT family N-acetyltransferase n=1 Tax=unclassified Streptomyces TaxID=2593676 RepID=UPI002255E7BC|nr:MULTISPECIES: GNAT family N-acetyltransferase [unclassified Streptomyces]MCX5057240.1 GNAT family N-acetyltransferase [Streptomyces sp. NBC_00452]
MPDLHIRTAREDDLPEICLLDREAFPAEPYPEFVLRQYFDLCCGHLIVVDDGTALRGYLIAAAPSDCGPTWLISLGVARDLRGRGLGRRLMTRMLDRLRSEGASEVRLAVDPDNEPAVHLYKSLGFTPLGGPRRDYFGAGKDRLLMALFLPAAPTPAPPRRP